MNIEENIINFNTKFVLKLKLQYQIWRLLDISMNTDVFDIVKTNIIMWYLWIIISTVINLKLSFWIGWFKNIRKRDLVQRRTKIISAFAPNIILLEN